MKTQRSYANRVINFTAVILAVLLMFAASGCGREKAAPVPATGTQKQAAGAGQESTATGSADGRTVYIEEFVCPYIQEGQGAALTPGMITAFLLVKVENTSSSDHVVGPDDFTLETESGESFSAVTGYRVANAINADVTIAPGASYTGALLFDIPDDIRVVNLVDSSSPLPLIVPLPRPVTQ